MVVGVRYQNLQYWLAQQAWGEPQAITPLANDASFRRYYRVHYPDRSLVVVDAPPAKENSVPFIEIGHALQQHDICVPQLFAKDLQQGFLLIGDLGDELYLSAVTRHSPDALYEHAVDTLVKLQHCQSVTNWTLPVFDAAAMQKELSLFDEWFLQAQVKHTLSPAERAMLSRVYQYLITEISRQPTVFTHGDFHSRNLLWTADSQVGVIDFQDAMYGPISYDLVSLLRDCYIVWPQHKIEQWVDYYLTGLNSQAGLPTVSRDEFMHWFNVTGLQRHLKVLGIFSRLNIRDDKPRYLADLPRVLDYVKQVGQQYPQLADLLTFINDKVRDIG
jgi:aminoglycoside/choline kinase family phosphotransferase